MDNKNGFTITNRDHLLRAWENATELVRDYQAYAREARAEDATLADLFSACAEEEAVRAAQFRDLLCGYEGR